MYSKIKKKPTSFNNHEDLKRNYLDRDSGIVTTEPESDAEYNSNRPNYIFSDDDDQPHLPSISLPLVDTTPSPMTVFSSPNYYCNLADRAVASLRQHLQDKEWKKVLKHKSGVTVYMLQKQQQQKTEKVALFRGESIIQGFTPQSIFYVIGMRKLWDEHFEEGNLIENLNETTSLTYESYKSTSTSKAFDLTLVEKIECSADGEIAFACTSIDTLQVPKQPGKNRHCVKLQGWVLKQLNTIPVSTKVTYVTQENINGWIPGLTKKSLARKPLIISSIHQYLEKKADRIRQQQQQQQQQSIRNHSTSTSSIHSNSTTLLVTPNTNDRLSPSITSPSPLSSLTKPDCSSDTSLDSVKKYTNIILSNPPPRISSLEEKNSQQNLPPPAPSPSFPLPLPPTTHSTREDILSSNDFPLPPIHRNHQHQRQFLLSPIHESDPIDFKEKKTADAASKSKLYPPSRHRQARKQSLDMLQTHANSSLNEWKYIGEKNQTQMYCQSIQGNPLPILRGETTLTGNWTPEQICSVIQCFGARKLWDEHFENGQIIERFSQKEYLVYTQMKSIFPIQSRDFSLLTSIESNVATGTVYVVSTSVEDELIPEKAQHIRGSLVTFGWALKPIKDGHRLAGVTVSIIAHLQMGGVTPLPSAIVRTLTTHLPSLGDQVQSYLLDHGCPPYIRRVAGKVILEQFDHQEKMYSIHFIAKHAPSARQYRNKNSQKMIGSMWCTDIRTHTSMYPMGYRITTTPHEGIRVDMRPDGMGFRIYTEREDMDGQTIQLQINPCTTTNQKPVFAWNDIVLLDFNIKIEEPIEAPKTEAKNNTKRITDQHDTKSVKANAYEKRQHRNSHILVLSEDIAFTAHQFSFVILLMAISYYFGKFSCHC